MRSLHVDTGRDMRGGQWQALYLLERLSDATLLAPSNSELFRKAEQSGIDVQPLSFAKLFQLSRRVDLTHAHDARAHTLAALAGGVPLFVSRRVAFPVKTSLPSQWKYEHAKMYLAVSNFVAGKLREVGVPESKIRVVYDGVPMPPPGHPKSGKVLVLEQKGGKIARILADSMHFSMHFVSDLWQDLSTAGIFLYLSEMEGLGSAVLAAMASGVPVIATRVGGLPEIVEDGRSGLLVDWPVNLEKLVAALRRLLDNPVAALEMGRQGRLKVEQNLSVEVMAERTLNAYKEGLAHKEGLG